MFVDDRLMAVLFDLELQTRSAAEQKQLVTRRMNAWRLRAVRYNEPLYLEQSYDGPLSVAVERELRGEVRYADKSRGNLLALIREHDADKVLSVVLVECSAELAVRALLREYCESILAARGTSRVSHVTLQTLAQHSQLIGQLLVDQERVEEILPRVQPANLLTALLNKKNYAFKPRDWLELCCLKGQESLFDALLTRTPNLASQAPYLALVLNQQSGTRPTSAATAILESAVKHGADVNARLPDNIPLRFRAPGVHSPLAIAHFGYKGSARIALVEWLLKLGARCSAEEVQSFAQNDMSPETRALVALNNYTPLARKGNIQGKKQYKCVGALATLLLEPKSFSYSVGASGTRERNEYSGTWQYGKSKDAIVCNATTQQRVSPRSSYSPSPVTHVKSCNLTFKFQGYLTYDGKVFLMSAGINTALLKLEQMYELLLLE
jgi:hypothetical protein